MNNTRPDLALKGVLRSNLPTMEGVLGLGNLNETTWRALGRVPHDFWRYFCKVQFLHLPKLHNPLIEPLKWRKCLDKSTQMKCLIR